jgi:hypothetical protein
MVVRPHSAGLPAFRHKPGGPRGSRPGWLRQPAGNRRLVATTIRFPLAEPLCLSSSSRHNRLSATPIGTRRGMRRADEGHRGWWPGPRAPAEGRGRAACAGGRRKRGPGPMRGKITGLGACLDCLEKLATNRTDAPSFKSAGGRVSCAQLWSGRARGRARTVCRGTPPRDRPGTRHDRDTGIGERKCGRPWRIKRAFWRMPQPGPA